MWHDVAMNSFTFSCDSCLHGTHEYVESQIHLKIIGYSKKQATVETATYGSEFVAPKTATEQIMDLRYTLRYLGVPIKSKSYIVGDNRSIVTSATLPHSALHNKHNILALKTHATNVQVIKCYV